MTAVESLRLLVCVGSGGVGKTTLAAALALRAALEGRRVLVLTIDPARRLADSLGLRVNGNEPVRVPLPEGEARGELWALMLDPSCTFRELIERVSPDPATTARILDNRIFQAIADSIAGSQDYMATELLFEVMQGGAYDLVVLDTPPSSHALDFLDAPGRLARFTDRQIMRWFLAPTERDPGLSRLLMGTSAVVFKLLAHIFGKPFLDELHEFFDAFRELYEGFRLRAERVTETFRAPGTAFLVVAAPAEGSLEVARFFLGELRGRGIRCLGLAVNRCHQVAGELPDPAVLRGPLEGLAADLPPATGEVLLARLGAADRRLRELAALEERRLQPMQRLLTRQQGLWRVPLLLGQAHDLRALAALAGHISLPVGERGR